MTRSALLLATGAVSLCLGAGPSPARAALLQVVFTGTVAYTNSSAFLDPSVHSGVPVTGSLSLDTSKVVDVAVPDGVPDDYAFYVADGISTVFTLDVGIYHFLGHSVDMQVTNDT